MSHTRSLPKETLDQIIAIYEPIEKLDRIIDAEKATAGQAKAGVDVNKRKKG